MGFVPIRPLTTLALLLALPLGAQEEHYRAKASPAGRAPAARPDEGEGPDEAWGRQQWWLERMGGKLGPDFTQHLLNEAARERAKYPGRFRSASDPRLMSVAASGSTWANLGPTSADFEQNGVTLNKVDSGRPRVILPDTTDATGNTVYILAAGGGLWKTTNFLASAPTWNPLTDFVGSTVSGSAAFGRNTSTIFVGAGDPFDNGVGGFMTMTTDGGLTWSPIPQVLGSASKTLDIKVDTSQSQDIVLVGTDAGLFRSGNGGASYSAVGSIPSNLKVWSLVKTSAGWLASACTQDAYGQDLAGSLYRSTDLGLTWTSVAGAPSGAGRMTLAVGAPGDPIVFAFAASANDAGQLDLFKSTDGGQTWTALGITSKAPTNPNSDQGTMDLMAGQAFYNHMILVDPTDASRNTIYLGGQLATAKTSDGGQTWTVLSDWLPSGDTSTLPYVHADCHCAAFSTFGGVPRLYFGTDGGLFTSTDAGISWDDTKNKGLVTHLIYALAASTGTQGSALIGVQDNGTRIRSGLTSTFNQVRGGDGFGVAWSPANNAASLSSYVYNSIQRSTTNPVVSQLNWNGFTSGLGTTGQSDGGTSYYFVTPICTPPATADASGQVFFTYGNTGTGTNSKKVFESNGTGWTTIGTLTHGVRGVSHGVGVSPTDLQHIATASSGGYVDITTNGGTTWTEVFLGVNGTDGQNIGWHGYNANVAWANNNLLYVCSEAPGTGATRVARSTNGGANWTAAATGLPDIPVTKLAVDPGDATGNTVYAATWLGVYKTTNGGTSWTLFGAKLPQGRVTDIWVAPDSSTIRVSTWGRGVWELQASSTANPTVALSPTAVTLINGGSQSFTPSVTNGTSNTVTWASANGGTVPAAATASGTAQAYTAPASGTSDTVTVTTVDTPTATASAAITLVTPAQVSVAVSPATVEMMTGTGTQSFTATVSPLTSQAVTWSGTGVTSGTFSASGLAAGSYTVTATSQASPTSTPGTATVTLIAAASVGVAVTPSPATTVVGGTLQFSAAVTGVSASNQGVTWSVSGGGSINTSGLFTATTQGSFTVTATNSFSGVTGTATVNVKTLDLNGDGTVSPLDLLTFAKYYGTSNAACDLNGDGTVDDKDLGILLAGL